MSHRDICQTCGQMYSLHDTNMHRIAELEREHSDLKAKYQKAVESLNVAISQMEYWSNEVMNWNVPAEFHSKRLKESAEKYKQTLAELGEKE